MVFKAQVRDLAPEYLPTHLIMLRFVLPSSHPGPSDLCMTFTWCLHVLLSSHLGYLVPTHPPDLRETVSDHYEVIKFSFL